ncbi:MAG TPA: YihY/virulence factor BrkB family protein [Acidimicrobiales bacterium]|nr:YihY/virulence factor BrkB family protein [Acidimicrobiales bacterium]
MSWYRSDDDRRDQERVQLPPTEPPAPSPPVPPPTERRVPRRRQRHTASVTPETNQAQPTSATGAGRDAQGPKTPTDLNTSSWSGVLKRTVREFKEDELVDRAAALTYYGVLAIFPAILALVSVLGLVGQSATQPLVDNLGKVAPGPAKDIFTTAIQNLQKSRGAGGVLFLVGLGLALWSASGYVAAFMRASNAIYEVEEGRPIWKKLPVRLGVTLVLVVLLAISALAVVLTGGLAKQAGSLFGIGETALKVWDIAKWPVLVLIVSLMFALLYWASPNVKQPGFRWLSPGGIVAVVVWLVVSAAFAFYVANFGSYNKTYGALAGVIIFLVWLWLSNIAVLLGAEFNAELERGRQIEAGHPAEEEPFLEPRDTRKMKS